MDDGQLLDALRLGGFHALVAAHDPARAFVDDDGLDNTKRRHGPAQGHQVTIRNRSRIVRRGHAPKLCGRNVGHFHAVLSSLASRRNQPHTNPPMR